MPILNGTLDKVLDKEKNKIDKYFKGAKKLKVKLRDSQLENVYNFYP